LARHLLASADATGVLDQTHQDLATAIGSVREVVSRRLEVFAKRGLVTLERGQIVIRDKAGLQQVAAEIVD
jgi:CRP/FNR family transcriptional regulator, anaerobic regulatory protein